MNRACRRSDRPRFLLSALSLACAALLAAKCNGGGGAPLAPGSGAPQYQELAVVQVPGGAVNAAGGNLLVTRTDLEIDTRLGPFAVGAAWSSATKKWHWSFDDTSYANGTFVDPTGAPHAVGSLGSGQAIPGTSWVKVSPSALKTKGGLQYEFTAGGDLQTIRWTSSLEPRLSFVLATLSDSKLHTTRIDQCLTSGCSPVFTFAYDAQARPATITDRAGRIASFGYDASGRLATARDGLDTAKGWPGFRYEYGASGELRALTNSEGERVELDYTGFVSPPSQVWRVRSIGGPSPIHTFSHYGPVEGLYTTYYTDPTGRQTRFRYDGSRRVRERAVPALGELTTFEWTGLRPSRITFPDGTSTELAYLDDDVASETQPSGNVVAFSYAPNAVNRDDPLSRPLLSASDTLGPVEVRTYDAQGRRASAANGAGETLLYTYGVDEMLSSVTSPAGVVTTFSGYGDHGHAAMSTHGETTLDFAYDPVGNLIQGHDFSDESAPGLGGIVSRAFDADRNVETVELADLISPLPFQSQTLTVEHRSDGQRTRILRPYGGDTKLLYDALGRLVTRREKADGVGHASWQDTGFGYDAAGRLASVDRPNGMGETWAYDLAGRVQTHSILQDGVLESQATRSYAAGRLVSLLDTVHDSAETYAYDTAGRIAAVTYPAGEYLGLSYDLRSRPSGTLFHQSLGGPLIRALAFEYDAASREREVRDGGTPVLTRTYQAGRLASVAYGNGLVRSFAYDPEGFPAGSTMTSGSMTIESTNVGIQASFLSDITVDAITHTFGTVAAQSSETYLLGPSESGSDPLSLSGKRVWAEATRVYEYDELSNLNPFNFGPYVFVYNPERNRLLRLDDLQTGAPVQTYAYDDAGYASSRDGVALDWNGAGRIRSIGSLVSFSWDTEGRLVSRAVAGVEQRHLFGGLMEADAFGNPTALDLGEVRIDLATGSHLYRHFDFRGNVKLTTDDQGDVRAHYHYSAYGLYQTYGDGGSVDENVSFAQGREYAGLLLFGGRLYDSDAGRFLAPDPIYQLINQYAYTLGNPVWFWDPGGRLSQAVAMSAAGFGLSAVGTGLAIVGVVVFPPATAGAAAFALVGIVVGELSTAVSFVSLVETIEAEGGSKPLPDVSGDREFLRRACGRPCQPPKSRGGGGIRVSGPGGPGPAPGPGGCGLGWELAPALLLVGGRSRAARGRWASIATLDRVAPVYDPRRGTNAAPLGGGGT